MYIYTIYILYIYYWVYNNIIIFRWRVKSEIRMQKYLPVLRIYNITDLLGRLYITSIIIIIITHHVISYRRQALIRILTTKEKFVFFSHDLSLCQYYNNNKRPWNLTVLKVKSIIILAIYLYTIIIIVIFRLLISRVIFNATVDLVISFFHIKKTPHFKTKYKYYLFLYLNYPFLLLNYWKSTRFHIILTLVHYIRLKLLVSYHHITCISKRRYYIIINY